MTTTVQARKGTATMGDDRRLRILVVDDEPQIRKALGINLRARGYEVELAATGEEGLRLAAERRVPLKPDSTSACARPMRRVIPFEYSFN